MSTLRRTRAGSSGLPALAFAVLGGQLLAFVGGCASDGNCNNFSTTSYLVFQSGAPTSAISVCTDGTDSGFSPPSYYYGSMAPDAALSIDGARGYPFPGSPPESNKALQQCAAVCGGATFSIPCCLSQWQPETVVCYPPCIP